ncbi:hypothetical protein WJX73_003251 [Symbiochloris irregularis]|uniref:Uncharacterized protein n=1 Tax=Symbiochloris irregularis TaxID=706552 RepID=A0AAW1NX46_9CHLO
MDQLSTTDGPTPFAQNYRGIPVRSISQPGQIIYWVVFGLMAGSALCFSVLVFLKPVAERSHGYVTLLIVTIASCAYYAMASTGGQIAISQYGQFQGPYPGTGIEPVLRSVYWARYIDWFLTTPLLLLDLLLIAAVPFGTALWIITADILMIVTGMFGALCSHKFKWGWYGAGCLFQVLLVYGVMVTGTAHAKARGRVTGNAKLPMVYFGLSAYLLMVWWGYPIVWGFCEGSNYASVNAEATAYGGLDVAAKVVFGWMLFALYPILSRQNKDEYARGAYLPPLLSAPINAMLWPSRPQGGAHQKGASTVDDTNGVGNGAGNGVGTGPVSGPGLATSGNGAPAGTTV